MFRIFGLLLILIVSTEARAQSEALMHDVELTPLRPENIAYSHGYWPTLGYDSLNLTQLYPRVQLIEMQYDSIQEREKAIVLLTIENRSWKHAYVIFPYYWNYEMATSPYAIYFNEIECASKTAQATFRTFNDEVETIDQVIYVKQYEQIQMVCVINEIERDTILDDRLSCFIHSSIAEWTFKINLEFWLVKNNGLPLSEKRVFRTEDFHTTVLTFNLDEKQLPDRSRKVE